MSPRLMRAFIVASISTFVLAGLFIWFIVREFRNEVREYKLVCDKRFMNKVEKAGESL